MIADPATGPAAYRPSFAAWLLRPFIDLGPCEAGPLYAQGVECYWEAFVDDASPRFALQRTLPPAFRTQVIDEAGRPEFRVSDPRDLQGELRTPRWSQLCHAIDGWDQLPRDRQGRLVLLLHALCFYPLVLALVPDVDPPLAAVDAATAELAYWRASARYVMDVPSRVADYRDADLSVFEAMAAAAPDAVTAFNAAVKVLVHKSKVGAPISELRKWSERAERAVTGGVSRLEPFERGLLTSRFYRAVAFLPQHTGDRAEVVRLMDLAERHALGLAPSTRAQELLYLENLHPVMESRTKEALWLGDLDLAVTRALKVLDLDPYDSKAWLELGEVRLRREEYTRAAEAYVVAATLGPPASAIARHMAGLCFRQIGQEFLAAFFFKDALEFDPRAISPRDEIRDLPDAKALIALKEWSRRTFEF